MDRKEFESLTYGDWILARVNNKGKLISTELEVEVLQLTSNSFPPDYIWCLVPPGKGVNLPENIGDFGVFVANCVKKQCKYFPFSFSLQEVIRKL